MKYVQRVNFEELEKRRAPYGARGLKSCLLSSNRLLLPSRPVWGAWIEIAVICSCRLPLSSRPVWGAWIEIEGGGPCARPPLRRAPYGLAFYRALLACTPWKIAAICWACGWLGEYRP